MKLQKIMFGIMLLIFTTSVALSLQIEKINIYYDKTQVVGKSTENRIYLPKDASSLYIDAPSYSVVQNYVQDDIGKYLIFYVDGMEFNGKLLGEMGNNYLIDANGTLLLIDKSHTYVRSTYYTHINEKLLVDVDATGEYKVNYFTSKIRWAPKYVLDGSSFSFFSTITNDSDDYETEINLVAEKKQTYTPFLYGIRKAVAADVEGGSVAEGEEVAQKYVFHLGKFKIPAKSKKVLRIRKKEVKYEDFY
jgi:hypothetical protein